MTPSGQKRKVEDEYEDDNPCDEVTDLLHAQPIETPRTSTSQKGKGRIGSYFMPRTTLGGQPTLKNVMQSKEVIEKCHLAISKLKIDAFVSFNATVKVPSQNQLTMRRVAQQPMIDVICSMGSGYKGPNYYRVRGHLVNKWVEDVKILVNDYRSIWKRTGCTLMADGWTDRNRRTLINFLVYCPKGTIFIKSIDVSHASKTADLLFKLFKEVVMYVGPENIVHIVTNNASNYVDAVSSLMGKKYFVQLQLALPLTSLHCKPLGFFEKHAHGDPDLLDKLTSEMRIYKDVKLDFGRPTAIHERSKINGEKLMDVVHQICKGWQSAFVTTIDLVSRIGVRKYWSVFEHIHTNKRNRLEHQKLNDLIFVRYNLKIQQRNHLRHQIYDLINLEIFEDHSHFILEESPPFLIVEEIEALQNDLANISIQLSLDDNDQLNLEDDDGAQLNSTENVNLNEDNIQEAKEKKKNEDGVRMR
ncbi:hypothetical protein Lal_00022724 [Lupinus albus]|nr:hypothetical protein Lal_00022724 [Lupinus albus]